MHAVVTTPLFSSTPKMDRVRSVNSVASVTTLWDPSISLTPNQVSISFSVCARQCFVFLNGVKKLRNEGYALPRCETSEIYSVLSTTHFL